MIRRLRRQVTARRVLTVALVATVALILIGASPVVSIWMAVAEVGLLFAYLNGKESYADFHALGNKTNGRRTIAVGNIRREIVRGLIASDFITIGGLVLLGVRGAVVPGLILGSLGMVLNSYLDRKDRLYLMEFGMQPRDQAGRFVKE